MKEDNGFRPYVPADKITPECTLTSVIMGVILAVVFGAANAYLGLRVGMTVSASIPAAVLSMGVIRILMKKNSILESNMVQTIGSAGESLAAGAIFTMPALFLWAKDGLCDKPGLVEITLIALCGGVLGVLFMVPLRNALIVKEHATLLYPEGTACADVLLAGEEGGANAGTVFAGMGLAAVFKFVVDGLKVIPADIAVAFKSFKGEIGMEVYPALLSVGYIVGPRISSYMFVGSLFGWMVIIPLTCLFGPDMWMYPADAGVTVAQLYAAGGEMADYLGRRFGERLLEDDGSVCKPALLEAMQKDPGLRKEVEQMVHALVRDAILAFWDKAEAEGKDCAVAEIPLYFECGWHKAGLPGALSLTVRCPREIRLQRIMATRGWSEEKAATLEAWQWPAERKEAASDLVVDNAGTPADLRARIPALLEQLTALRQQAQDDILRQVTACWQVK